MIVFRLSVWFLWQNKAPSRLEQCSGQLGKIRLNIHYACYLAFQILAPKVSNGATMLLKSFVSKWLISRNRLAVKKYVTSVILSTLDLLMWTLNRYVTWQNLEKLEENWCNTVFKCFADKEFLFLQWIVHHRKTKFSISVTTIYLPTPMQCYFNFAMNKNKSKSKYDATQFICSLHLY